MSQREMVLFDAVKAYHLLQSLSLCQMSLLVINPASVSNFYQSFCYFATLTYCVGT